MGRNPKLLSPGLHWKLPFFDAVFSHSVRRRYSTFGPQTVTTLDGHTLTIGGAVAYSIKDLLDLFDRLQHPEDAIRSLSMGAIADYVSTHDLLDCTPSGISSACREDLGLRKFGLLVSQFTLTTYARVRTYRLIMDNQEGVWGSPLDISKQAHEAQ